MTELLSGKKFTEIQKPFLGHHNSAEFTEASKYIKYLSYWQKIIRNDNVHQYSQSLWTIFRDNIIIFVFLI